MKNQIITCYFVHQSVYTVIRNPSHRVHVLMENISSLITDGENNTVAYTHIDIGTKENMEKLFSDLEAA